MDKITEEHIEQFVRFPDSLSKEQYRRIKNALDSSPELKELAEWLSEFYEEVDQLMAMEKHVIPLTHFTFSAQDKKVGNDAIVLAAMSPDTTISDQLKTLATFASTDDQVIIRFLEDKARDEYKIHLIRNNSPDPNELSLILFEDHDLTLLVDKSRHLSFKPSVDVTAMDWENAQVSLHLPWATFSVDKQELEQDSRRLKVAGNIINMRCREQELTVELNSDIKSGKGVKAVIQEKDKKVFYRFTDMEKMAIPIRDCSREFTLWLFR